MPVASDQANRGKPMSFSMNPLCRHLMIATALALMIPACSGEGGGGESADADPGRESSVDEANAGEWHFSRWKEGKPPKWKIETSQIPERPGIYEVTRYPDSQPTWEQRRSADELIEQSIEAAQKNGWFDYETGLEDGYRLMTGNKTHYVNDAFLADDRVLDPERPEFLMYYETPTGTRLTGAMFVTETLEERGAQIGGPLTVWHFHIWPRKVCIFNNVVVKHDRDCPGVRTKKGPEMIHVWFVDRPGGAFNSSMSLPPELLGMPEGSSEQHEHHH